MSDFKIGDVVWVDEGDNYGCTEYGGVVERIAKDGTLSIRVTSHPIGHGAATGSLRKALRFQIIDHERRRA